MSKRKNVTVPAGKPAKVRRINHKKAFLAAFKETASITVAARSAGVRREQHYKWMADPGYAADFDAAREEAIQTLEDEAVRRARNGTQRPVFYQGEECGLVYEYSDSLLMFLLRSWKPEKYRESVEQRQVGPNGGPIETKLEVVFKRPE